MARTEPDPDPDAALLTRWRQARGAARDAAERELFERFLPAVERLLGRLLGADREDCVQEAFLDVFAGLAAFEGRARLSTWIYRVALRRGWKCLARRRRALRGRGTAGDDDDAAVDVEQLPAVTPSAASRLEGAELARRFEQALDRLDLDQRTVLALAAVEGLGPAQIAEVLGLPVGTVHSRLHRARERMRELLGLAD